MISLVKGQPNSVFDADGSTIIIHAGADDYKTDPAGNSGDRIACGIIVQ
jgi:Cu-Zn family superoxide dismutase